MFDHSHVGKIANKAVKSFWTQQFIDDYMGCKGT